MFEIGLAMPIWDYLTVNGGVHGYCRDASWPLPRRCCPACRSRNTSNRPTVAPFTLHSVRCPARLRHSSEHGFAIAPNRPTIH
jgi:hypothetical protein